MNFYQEVIHVLSRSSHRTVGFLVFSLLLIGVLTTVVLFQQQQSLQQDAATYSRGGTISIVIPNNGEIVSGTVTIHAKAHLSTQMRSMSLSVNNSPRSPQNCGVTSGLSSYNCYWQWFVPPTGTGTFVLVSSVTDRNGRTFKSNPIVIYRDTNEDQSLNSTPTPTPSGDHTISGRVYMDANKNENFDGNELPYAKIATVRETTTNKVVKTDANGIYRFPAFYEGAYQVKIDSMYGLEITSQNPVPVSLKKNTQVNFGLYQTL